MHNVHCAAQHPHFVRALAPVVGAARTDCDRLSRIADESVRRLENVRAFVKGLAQEMGMPDAEGFSRVWQLLMLGAITAAVRGDREAALRAKEIGLALLEGPYAA